MKKFLLTTTGLTFAFVLAATPAEAGPVAAVVTWAAGVIKAGGLGAALLKTAIGIGANALVSAIFKPKLQSNPVGVKLELKMGDDQPLAFIVGDYVTAGQRRYIGSWGRETRFVTEVIEVSCLPQGLDAVWINDEVGLPVANTRAWIGGDNPSDDRSWQEGSSVPAGSLDIGQPYSNFSDDGNRIAIKWVDGNQTAADPFLVRVFSADPDYPWTSKMIGRGKSYAIITTRFDSDSLTDYPSFLFKPKPLKMYDVRKDSTNGGNGTHRWGNRSTYQETLNPAVIAYNIARGIYWGSEWVFGGQNLPAWRLPSADWIAAANACDIPRNTAGGGTEPSYRCGLEIEVNMEPADILEELEKSSNMKTAEAGGYLKPTVDLPASAVFSFEDKDIQISEGQSYQPHFILAETYNSIQATYPEPRERWSNKDAPEYRNEELIDADGGRYLPFLMSYDAVPFPRQVQRLMRSQLKDYRRFRRHSFHLPPEAYGLEPNDMVSWSSVRNGYNNKLFTVESVAKMPSMKVLVSLREVDPSDYDWSSAYEKPISIVIPVNPRPFTQTIRGFNVFPDSERNASGQPRKATIRCEAEGSEVNIKRIHIRARVKGDPRITHDVTFPWIAPFTWHLRDLVPLQTYEVQARLLSSRTPRTQWTGWLEVTTPQVELISIEDMAEDIYEEMKDIAESAGVTPVDELPATGEPNRIYMKVPEGSLWRWDPTLNGGSGGWNDKVYGGIPDGFIDETKFAEGIEPVKIIPDGQPLPTTKSTETIAWNGESYVWDGSKYVSQKFKLTPGLIEAQHIADAAVSAQKIANNSITALKLVDGSITETKITDGAISTRTIQANAIGADQIAANAVVASKIAIGDFTNLITNPDFTTDLGSTGSSDGWTLNASASVQVTPAGQEGKWGVRFSAAGLASWNSRIPVKAGEEFFISALFRGSGSTPRTTNRIYIEQRNSDYAGMVNQVIYHQVFLNTLVNLAAASYVVPEGVSYICVHFQRPDDGNQSGHTFVTLPMLRRKNGGELIVDGAITATKIATGAVVADKIDANAVTAVKIAAGSIVTDKIATDAITAVKIAAGAVKAEQISAGAITTVKLASGSVTTDALASGSVTTDALVASAVVASKIAAGAVVASKISVSQLSAISANMGAITAGSLNINGNFIVDSSGNTTIRSGTTGARLVITNNRIDVRDASGALRVRIGEL